MATAELIIRPRRGWAPIDFRELWLFRELLGFLVWRDIKVRYKQTFLGGLWAIIQPLIGTLVFGILFTRIAPVHTDYPYPLFVYIGLVPWTFFANAVTLASNSLIGSEQMVRKTYFPRLLLPLGATAALGLDMLVSLIFMGILMLYYRFPLTQAFWTLPIFLLGAILTASGLGFFLSALNVRYRDIKYIVPFFTQMAFFVTPVIYPLRSVPGKMAIVMAFNPMSGIIEGWRYAVLGSPLSWSLARVSFTASALLFVAGLYFFRRMERTFADVI